MHSYNGTRSMVRSFDTGGRVGLHSYVPIPVVSMALELLCNTPLVMDFDVMHIAGQCLQNLLDMIVYYQGVCRTASPFVHYELELSLGYHVQLLQSDT